MRHWYFKEVTTKIFLLQFVHKFMNKIYTRNKGSHRFRKVLFFLTLFKRPLTPPLLFEHLSYFAGGVFKHVFKRMKYM